MVRIRQIVSYSIADIVDIAETPSAWFVDYHFNKLQVRSASLLWIFLFTNWNEKGRKIHTRAQVYDDWLSWSLVSMSCFLAGDIWLKRINNSADRPFLIVSEYVNQRCFNFIGSLYESVDQFSKCSTIAFPKAIPIGSIR